jgi:hypothetical protein
MNSPNCNHSRNTRVASLAFHILYSGIAPQKSSRSSLACNLTYSAPNPTLCPSPSRSGRTCFAIPISLLASIGSLSFPSSLASLYSPQPPSYSPFHNIVSRSSSDSILARLEPSSLYISPDLLQMVGARLHMLPIVIHLDNINL